MASVRNAAKCIISILMILARMILKSTQVSSLLICLNFLPRAWPLSGLRKKAECSRRGRQRIDREDSGAQLTARLASISTPLVSRTYTVLSQPLYTQLLPYHKLQLTFLTSCSVFRCGSIALHLCLPSRAFLCKVHILTDSSGVNTNTETNTSVDNVSEVWILLIKTPRRAR